MCASSAVSDYYRDTYPNRFPTNPYPFAPPLQGGFADIETREMMKKVIQLLEKIDKKLGDVECSDENKEAFKKQVGL